MQINIHVIPKAKQNAVKDGESLRVHTTAAPEDNKANLSVIKLLAEHFGVAKSCVRIIRGASARNKVVEISAPGEYSGRSPRPICHASGGETRPSNRYIWLSIL
jgi:uncharacterized protein (TIGR00251 family)